MTKYIHQKKEFSINDTPPRGNDIFNHCKTCKEYIRLDSNDCYQCNCGNIAIDGEYARLLVGDYTKFVVALKFEDYDIA